MWRRDRRGPSASPFFCACVCPGFRRPGPQQKTFTSPEEAVKAMIAAVRAHDLKTMRSVLGPGSRGVVYSGDEAADREDREAFVKAYDERHRIEMAGETRAILRVGNNDWPMPIPIVKQGKSWRFDTKARQGGDPDPENRQERTQRDAGLSGLR